MNLRDAVAHARTPAVQAAVHAIYTDLMSRIDLRRPRCDASGRCCHFDTFGHRLYVTTAELATFLTDLDTTPAPPSPAIPSFTTPLPIFAPNSSDSCPFLRSNLCSVHNLRPFGCRIFYCDPAATDWMESTYADIHQQLKQIHLDYDLVYHYVEWRSALAELLTPRLHS